jgi:hypothetical protein
MNAGGKRRNSSETPFCPKDDQTSNLKEGCKGIGCRKGTSFMLDDENVFIGTASCILDLVQF